MEKGVFTVDDIHKLRIEKAEQRAKMSKEEAEHDFRESVEFSRRAIEEARKTKRQKVM